MQRIDVKPDQIEIEAASQTPKLTLYSCTLAGAMSAMQTAVTSSVSTASSWLYDAGKNIITGLISGIEDMAWQAAQAAIAVVRDAVNAAP